MVYLFPWFIFCCRLLRTQVQTEHLLLCRYAYECTFLKHVNSDQETSIVWSRYSESFYIRQMMVDRIVYLWFKQISSLHCEYLSLTGLWDEANSYSNLEYEFRVLLINQSLNYGTICILGERFGSDFV